MKTGKDAVVVDSCQGCTYYRHYEKGSGTCHRYPPSYAGDASPKESHHWKYPVVNGHGWCGEFHATRNL